MMNKDSKATNFMKLEAKDKDLTMFTMTGLELVNNKEQVHMVIFLKRKIQTELLTTYLPTLLLLSISYATTFFKPEYFEASLTVNLTIMLVMTTIFTTKISELPPTSDMKMLDAWLIFCLFIPFAFSLIQTAIENYRDAIDDADPKRPVSAWTEPFEDDQKVLLALQSDAHTIAPHRDPIQPNPSHPTYSSKARKTHDVIYF